MHWHSRIASANRPHFPKKSAEGSALCGPDGIGAYHMKFRPLHDRVAVRRVDSETKTAGGIIIPDTAAEKPQQGEIIAVGPGARDERRQDRPPRAEAEGQGAVRQVVRHRGQDRRRRSS